MSDDTPLASTPPFRRSGRSWFPYVHEGALGYLGLIALGVLLDWLALPPGPAPILVFVADVPFLLLLWHCDGKRWKRWAFLYGVVHFAVATRWVMVIDPRFILGTALILGPVYVLLGLAIRWIEKRDGPFVVGVGLCVVLEELLRTVWMGGMPWPARSLSFATSWVVPMDALVPATAYVGAYGLSFVAGAFSAVAARVLLIRRKTPALRSAMARRLANASLVPVGFVALLALLAIVRHTTLADRSEDEAYDVGTFLSVQADVAQNLKHGEAWERDQMFQRHLDLTSIGTVHVGDGKVFCVMWPETMVPWVFVSPELAARFPETWANQVRVMRRIQRAVPEGETTTLLVGAVHHFQRGNERHSDSWSYGAHDSLFHVEPRFVPDKDSPFDEYPRVEWEDPNWIAPWERGRHDKINLVPGGEYTPLGEVLPFLRWFRNLVSMIPELDPGAKPGRENQAPFVLQKHDGHEVRAGTVVCFDLAFPETCREWRAAGAQVLLNTANYGWFWPYRLSCPDSGGGPAARRGARHDGGHGRKHGPDVLLRALRGRIRQLSHPHRPGRRASRGGGRR